MEKRAIPQGQIKIIFVYPTDPNIEIMGGMARYFRFLLRQSLIKGAKVKFVGVELGGKELIYPSNFTFIPIIRGTDKWWKYLIVSFFRVPFLKFESDEIIHSGRLIFLLPYILFHPKNPKLLTSDQPRLAAYLAYPKPIYYIFSTIYTPIEYFMIKRVKAVISAKHVFENYWKKRYPHLTYIFRERIYPAVGVDTEVFRPLNKKDVKETFGFNSTTKILLYVGRLSVIKGVDFLIDVFAEFNNNESNSIFIIVGRGEEEKRLREYANKKVAEDKILFLGEKRGEELVNIYNCADVLLIGSWAEGNSGVLREALACGVPVVSMNVGDAKEILKNPLLGCVVEERDPKLFAKTISETISQNQEKTRETCRKKGFEFSEEASFETVYKFYENILNNG